ncbi:Pyruvate dehydrogenase complex repressor [Planctomycetes bacterium CA13]|uniref:Pyruvate dehydrogenase complex repressor n=2 Tax=Novipirellula herctigrandis TaxID=2527986 RepID=A0A5C5Z8Q6_9BACT|nr:Pyruvate dehydrogenase complex repressor [Planctomycetes bacterium CA13]
MASIRTPRNLCGQVVHDLGSRILAGEVKPGEPLPQETTLCEEMGVSRTVVREAIKSLAAKGLVESRAKRGTIVRPARVWNYLDPEVLEWQSQSDVNGQLLRYLTEFRQAIEPTAAALAAERASDDERALIQEAWEEMARGAGSVEAFHLADTRFHTEILHATGNPFFAPVANVISVSLEASLEVTNRQPVENLASVPVHQKVLDAILARKPKEASEAMRSHLKDAADRIERVLGSG